MISIGSILKMLAAFGCGAAVAAAFLRVPIDTSGARITGLPHADAGAAAPAATPAPPIAAQPSDSVRVISIDQNAQRGAETTGAATGDETPPAEAARVESNAGSAPPSCNVTACSKTYRSFDSATCTYQPYEGTRRLCQK